MQLERIPSASLLLLRTGTMIVTAGSLSPSVSLPLRMFAVVIKRSAELARQADELIQAIIS
jgi:hypothetical protein